MVCSCFAFPQIIFGKTSMYRCRSDNLYEGSIMAFLSVAAISVSAVMNTIGVNTHLDSFNYGYQNLAVTAAAINYLGFKNLRDSAQHSWDLTLWTQVASAT